MEGFWNKFCQIWQLILLGIIGTTADINCNFDDGQLCEGWTIEHNTTICAANWTIWKGRTQTSNTGPSSDRQNKDGFYIYMETTNQKHKDIAIFYTPILQPVNVLVNTSFWYHMHGIFIQSFKIYLHVSGSNHRKLIKKIQGDQGTKWNLGTVYFEESNPFRLAFQAMVGSTSSDIAVDDISIAGAVYYDPHAQTTVLISRVTDSIPDGVIRENFIPLPYIIICSVGGCLWLVIIILLCWCVYKGNELHKSKQDAACNTTLSVSLQEDMFSDDKNEICNEDIELVLNAKNLKSEYDICERDYIGTKF